MKKKNTFTLIAGIILASIYTLVELYQFFTNYDTAWDNAVEFFDRIINPKYYNDEPERRKKLEQYGRLNKMLNNGALALVGFYGYCKGLDAIKKIIGNEIKK